MRPTEEAKDHFNTAQMLLRMGESDFKSNGAFRVIQRALQSTVAGLSEMATAQRATYILLEEVKELLQRQNAQLAGRR
jgi:hypothetical protein